MAHSAQQPISLAIQCFHADEGGKYAQQTWWAIWIMLRNAPPASVLRMLCFLLTNTELRMKDMDDITKREHLVCCDGRLDATPDLVTWFPTSFFMAHFISVSLAAGQGVSRAVSSLFALTWVRPFQS